MGNRGWHLGCLDSRVFFNCSRTAWSSLRVAILSMSLCCFSFSLARIAATSASDLGGVSASVDTSGRVSEAPRRPGAIGRTHLLDPLFRRCIERSVARFVAPTPRAPPMAACGHSAAHIADDIAEVVLTRPGPVTIFRADRLSGPHSRTPFGVFDADPRRRGSPLGRHLPECSFRPGRSPPWKGTFGYLRWALRFAGVCTVPAGRSAACRDAPVSVARASRAKVRKHVPAGEKRSLSHTR